MEKSDVEGKKSSAAGRGIPRRGLIKAGLAGAGGLLAHELLNDKTLEEGLPTQSAVFYPIYEYHVPGADYAGYLHYPPLDECFIELLGYREIQRDLIIPYTVYCRLDLIDKRPLPTDIKKILMQEQVKREEDFIAKLANDKSGLVFLDVDPFFFQNDNGNELIKNISVIEGIIGPILLILPEVVTAIKKGSVFSRREFIKWAARGSGAFLMSSTLGLWSMLLAQLMEGKRQLSSLRHVLLKIDGFQSHFHP